MTITIKGSSNDINNEDCLPWYPPLIDSAGNIIPSAEKEDRQRHELESKRRNEIVGQTIQRPKKLKPMTAKQLSDLTESAYQDGYTSGFKQGEEDGKQKGQQAGLKQGLEESRVQTAPHRQQLQQLIDDLLIPFEGHTKQLERMLLHTVVALTKTITQRELITDSTHIEKFVREALHALPSGSDNIAIHVHPNDLALLNDFYVERVNDWQLVSDPRITKGGCKVETKQSLVDFSVESRLQDLCKQFIDGKLMDASASLDEDIDLEVSQEKSFDDDQLDASALAIDNVITDQSIVDSIEDDSSEIDSAEFEDSTIEGSELNNFEIDDSDDEQQDKSADNE